MTATLIEILIQFLLTGINNLILLLYKKFRIDIKQLDIILFKLYLC